MSISYTDENGVRLPIKYGPVEWSAPLHDKIIDRIYVEIMTTGGVPLTKVLGVITRPTGEGEVKNMLFKGKFFNIREREFNEIWINEEVDANMLVIIPPELQIDPMEKQSGTTRRNDKRDDPRYK